MSLEWLAEYAKNPTYKYRMENPDIVYTEHNRTCGDVMTVYLRLDTDKQKILDFSFE
jgi:NifU-like protein involved in Fe-S cluster formation